MLFYVMNYQAERREGVKAVLRQVHRQARVSEAGDWRHLERLLSRGLPDLLVIDWQRTTMPVEALRSVRAAHPALAIAVLTDDGDATTVGPLVKAGALGVIPRDLEPRLILRALEFVLLGGYYVPVGALGPDMQPVAQTHADTPAGRPLSRNERAERAALLAGCRAGTRRAARAGLLSPRQQQIMRLVHLGNTNKNIARVLGISEGTVKIHLAAVFRLLGAANRAAAVALYNGWQHGEWPSLAGDVGSHDTHDTRGAPMRSLSTLSSSLRIAQRRAAYDSGVLPARRGDREPPYLIAAQPEWPYAPPRRRAPHADMGEGEAAPAFQVRAGATPRRRGNVGALTGQPAVMTSVTARAAVDLCGPPAPGKSVLTPVERGGDGDGERDSSGGDGRRQ